MGEKLTKIFLTNFGSKISDFEKAVGGIADFLNVNISTDKMEMLMMLMMCYGGVSLSIENNISLSLKFPETNSSSHFHNFQSVIFGLYPKFVL